MRVTLRDVAGASGVSVMAVSNVLHGTGKTVRVSEATSERIKQVAKELAYRPNTLARSLRNRKTHSIALVFQHVSRFADDNPYFPQLLNGVMGALFPENYSVTLCPNLKNGTEPGLIDDGRFDGILWARPDVTPSVSERFSKLNLPIVVLHAPPGAIAGVPTFCVDNGRALQLVVDHLVGLGHRSASFVVDSVNAHTTEGIARSNAFCAAASAAGIQGNIWVWDESAESLSTYLRQRPFETALAVFSDTLAGRILITCQQLGIRVPEDLSVVGFDSSSFCERTIPPLTSLRQQVEKIAFDATTHLLAIIRGNLSEDSEAQRYSTLYDCSLDVRASTSQPSMRKLENEITKKSIHSY